MKSMLKEYGSEAAKQNSNEKNPGVLLPLMIWATFSQRSLICNIYSPQEIIVSKVVGTIKPILNSKSNYVTFF